jgi:DNA-binding PadR family transcriptional regulator
MKKGSTQMDTVIKSSGVKSNDNNSLSTLEEDILTILASHPELYGLQISKAIEQASDGKRQIGFGSLYPALRRLENKKFVASRWENDNSEARGGARRRYYKITASGLNVLRENQTFRTKLANWQPA